jgi:peptidoglycan/LPS O-acetylase OafA/YrhL
VNHLDNRVTAPHDNYRPDIDGLRAIAVGVVVVFHAFPGVLPHGFIGVDVFFVISGFLISTMIFRQVEAGTFSISSFYVRRIRRLFPALVVVLAAVYMAGWRLLLPDELAQLGKHVAGGAGFSANLLLWGETGYFDTAAETKPLLHLWSLGIEEQFYLFWPVLLRLLWRPRFNLLTGAIVVASVSFYFNVTHVRLHADAVFYLPGTRLWELLVGAVVGYLNLRATRRPSRLLGRLGQDLKHVIYDRESTIPPEHVLRSFVSIVGMLCIGIALVAPMKHFPGWFALWPVLGAALIIAAGPSALPNRLLSMRPFVWVGRISYPLYLWHWPVLCFARIGWPANGTSAAARLALVAGSVVLAWLTYRFIERPVRYSRRRQTAKMASLIVSMAVLFVLGIATWWFDGFPARFPPVIRELASIKSEFPSSYRYRQCFLSQDQEPSTFTGCPVVLRSAPRQQTILLWGDSYAAHFMMGLQSAVPATAAIVQRTAAGCPPIPGLDLPDVPLCKAVNASVVASLPEIKPDLVILGGNWLRHDWQGLGRTIEVLRAAGVSRIVLVGIVPRWDRPLPRILSEHVLADSLHRVPTRLRDGFDRRVHALDSVMAAFAGQQSVSYVSPIRILCNDDGCLTRLGEAGGTVVAWDTGHLVDAASIYLFQHAALP